MTTQQKVYDALHAMGTDLSTWARAHGYSPNHTWVQLHRWADAPGRPNPGSMAAGIIAELERETGIQICTGEYPTSVGVLAGLRAARTRANKTTAEVGSAVGVSREVVHRWEKRGHGPDADNLRKLAKALNATYDELFYGIGGTTS